MDQMSDARKYAVHVKTFCYSVVDFLAENITSWGTVMVILLSVGHTAQIFDEKPFC